MNKSRKSKRIEKKQKQKKNLFFKLNFKNFPSHQVFSITPQTEKKYIFCVNFSFI